MSKGILLVNLGSPDSPSPKDVKKYLGEFLMDKRVIDVPLWARNLLDEDYDTRGFRFGNNPGNGYAPEKYTQKGEPRVFGVNVSIDF